MGLPMVRNLARAGYRMSIHDLNDEALRRACEATGAEAPSSLKALAERSAAVITMLPDGSAVRAVLGLEKQGDSLLAGLARGSVFIGEACVEAWCDAQSALGSGADHTAVARYWEQLAGTLLGGRKG